MRDMHNTIYHYIYIYDISLFTIYAFSGQGEGLHSRSISDYILYNNLNIKHMLS